MADSDRPLTSEELAAYLDTNPVVVRQVLAGLRDRGLVGSAKGHRGGWTLLSSLDTITLQDIHDAIGAPSHFAMGHRRRDPDCLVEQVVNEAVDGVLQEAERLLAKRFTAIRLADLAADFKRRRSTHPRKRHANAH